MSTAPCFGIDLGTTTSAIGRVVDGNPVLYPVDGAELLPSVVHLSDSGDMVVGQAAVNQELLAPERTIRSSKRHMGTAHTWQVGDRSVTPVEVATAILRKLGDAAEAATGARPERVVITVPAWFTQAQRAATRQAGEDAGYTVERILNEPTAAALAHAHGRELHRKVLVYDFGGGTFDVSLIEQDGPLVEVKASHGDAKLGGDDVDQGLIDYVIERVESEGDAALAGLLRSDAPARLRLRTACEEVKKTLSDEPTATLRAPFLGELDGKPQHLELQIPREELEEIVIPLINRTITCVDQVLADSGATPSDIESLILVGGSTRLPQVWEWLRRRYGLEGDASIPVQRAVALGAAIQAAILDGSRVDGILLDVAPYALSIGVSCGGIPGYPTHFACQVVTPRNAPLPSRHTHLVRTSHPEQERVRLPVYQGSHPHPDHNIILGEVVLEDLPNAPSDQLFRPIAITFHHDLDGMVEITVLDQLAGLSTTGRIAADGSEQAELRAFWLEHAQKHELTLGDDTAAPVQSGADDEGVSDAVMREARDLFHAAYEARDQLAHDHPEIASAIADHVTAGRLAHGMNHRRVCLEHYEALQDLFFEEGIYL